MTWRPRLATLAFALSGATACAEAVSEDAFYEKYPAATAPFLFAKSRLSAVGAELASSRRVRSIHLEPDEADLKALDGSGQTVIETEWRTDPDGVVQQRQKRLRPDVESGVAVDDAFDANAFSVLELPRVLRAALAELRNRSGTRRARVEAVDVTGVARTVKIAVECSDYPDDRVLTYSADGILLSNEKKKRP